MIFSFTHIELQFTSLLLIFFFEKFFISSSPFHYWDDFLSMNIRIINDFVFLLAIVPIEYFSDRNGSGGNTNGSKIKSLNEENRV